MNQGNLINPTTNFGQLVGKVLTKPVLTHSVFSEHFYEFMLEVKRLSGQADIIPICFSERTFSNTDLLTDNTIIVTGEFRSRNKMIDQHSRLLLSFFAKNIDSIDENIGEGTNCLKLSGFICKPPVFRTTPFNREICDLLVAVNRPFNKRSDYIPCLAWGRNARFASELPVGSGVKIEGRIQSRPYEKKTDIGVEQHTAYEVSISVIGQTEGHRDLSTSGTPLQEEQV